LLCAIMGSPITSHQRRSLADPDLLGADAGDPGRHPAP
jgi:hypothetical protein